jgi:hydroxyacylglutathione hydrolase
MNHVVTTEISSKTVCGGAGRVYGVAASRDNLVWLLECVVSGVVAVVDGPDAAGALQKAASLGLSLSVVLNTHTHPDHIGVNKDLARRGLLTAMTVVGCAERAADVPGITHPVSHGDKVSVGQLEGRVIRGDGHIDGHISFLFGDALFCGDTLFTGGCGRPFDGPPEKLYESLMALAELPEETNVFCAHEYTAPNLAFARKVDPDNETLQARWENVKANTGSCFVPSTIGIERETNPFLRASSAADFCALRAAKSRG